jgi:hypothetical protein
MGIHRLGEVPNESGWRARKSACLSLLKWLEARGRLVHPQPTMKRFFAILALVSLASSAFSADKKSIVMIAGKPSHGPGQHEHNAGIQLLKKCLEQGAAEQVDIKYHLNGEWPSQEELSKADTVVIYSDGGGGHPALQEGRLAQLDTEMKRGCGFLTIHYAVEPTIEKGNKEFIDWMGGALRSTGA